MFAKGMCGSAIVMCVYNLCVMCKQVMSRSGDECVVALTDQWYMAYGEDVWQALTREALAGLEVYSDEARAQFSHCLGKLCDTHHNHRPFAWVSVPCDNASGSTRGGTPRSNIATA